LPSGKDIVDVIMGEPGQKSDITLFLNVRKTSLPNKNFKEIKVIKEKHQLKKTPTKNRKKELTLAQFRQNLRNGCGRILTILIRVVKKYLE